MCPVFVCLNIAGEFFLLVTQWPPGLHRLATSWRPWEHIWITFSLLTELGMPSSTCSIVSTQIWIYLQALWGSCFLLFQCIQYLQVNPPGWSADSEASGCLFRVLDCWSPDRKTTICASSTLCIKRISATQQYHKGVSLSVPIHPPHHGFQPKTCYLLRFSDVYGG